VNQPHDRVRGDVPNESPTDSSLPSSTRRELLKLVGLAGLGGLTGFGTGRARAETAPLESLRVQRTPLAVAMWDYSWLTRRSGREAEFADFDAVLDDFVARGYNALRIDAFPHLIANGAGEHRQPSFDMRPQWGGFPWGNSDYVNINPRRHLPEFMRKCAARGLRIGLSTWLTNDTSDRATAIASPADLADCWSATLECLGEHGLLGMVEWVDLGNEFPSVAFMPSVVAHINSGLDSTNQIGRLHGYLRPYTPAQGAAISTYMQQAITTLKTRFPSLPFCFSLLGDGTTATFAHHDLSCFDLLEPHIWLGQNTRFGLRSGLDLFLLEGFGPVQTPRINLRVENQANNTYFRQRDQLLDWLGKALDSWVELGNRLGVPVYTTEAWASTNYYDLPALDPDSSAWAWVFDAAVNAATMAKQRGWSGICSSNFCEPMFPAFYDDISWHREIAGVIRA
jgi:hypothetical protein